VKRAIALAATLAFAVLGESEARAQQVEVVTVPSREMIGTGIFTFAIPYTISVVVGATSNTAPDHLLFIPLVGPWLDLAERPSCPITAPSCNSETAARVGLVFDGVFQGIGVLMVVTGLLWRHEVVATRVSKVHISPYFGPTGSGLSLNGSF
jgi:hypothetical protein